MNSTRQLSKNSSIREETQEPNRISNGPNIYQIGTEIGRGGFAVVFQAFNVETGDFVAIKRFPLKAIDDDSLSSIESEIELMQKLNHPNIVKYIDTIRTKDFLHIVLEYMENGSLSNVIKRFGSFSESLTAIYVTQVLRGLKYLHEQGVLHRDIKGANILTTKDGMVKLADFGVAMKLSEVHENDQDVVGSPYWIAPEIIEMSAPTAACDIWSVGCIIIELLTRKPPYYDLTPMAALFRIVQDDYPPLPEGISQALRDFLLLCFQKEPVMRSSAAKLLDHPWLRNSSTSTSLVQTSKLLASKSSTSFFDDDLEISGSADSIVNTVRNYQLESENILDSSRCVTSNNDFLQLLVRKEIDSTHSEITVNNKYNSFNDFDDLSQHAKNVNFSSNPKTKYVEDDKKLEKLDRRTVKTTKKSCNHLNNSADSNHDIDVVNVPFSKKVDEKSAIEKVIPDFNGSFITRFQERPDEANFDDLHIGMSDYSKQPTSFSKAYRNQNSSISNQRLINFDTHSNSQSLQKSFSGQVFFSVEVDNENLAVDEAETDNSYFGGDLANNLRSRMRHSIKELEGEGDLETDEFINYKFDAKDFKQNESKDVHFRRSREVVDIMSQIRSDTNEVVVFELCCQLMAVFAEYPDQREHLVTYHGVMPIIDMIEARTETEILTGEKDDSKFQVKLQPHVLRVVNRIIDGSIRAQEQLSLVGIIPTIMNIFNRSHQQYTKQIMTLMPHYSFSSQGDTTVASSQGINSVDPVTLEAARFIHLISSTSSLTLQMLIGAGGLSVLTNMVSFGGNLILRKDPLNLLSSNNDCMAIFQMGVDCVTRVFSVQSSRTRDFCRLFVKLGLLRYLSVAFRNILSLYLLKINAGSSAFIESIRCTTEIAPSAEHNLSAHQHHKILSDSIDSTIQDSVNQSSEKKYTENIAMLFLKFSRSDSVVAEMMVHDDLGVVNAIVSALKTPELTGAVSSDVLYQRKKHGCLSSFWLYYVEIVEILLKCIKNLSMEPSTLLGLEQAGVIEVLIPLLSGPFGEKCKNYILPALFNICRINKRRQEQASMLGIIPHLKRIISDGSHLRQFALPILFDLAHTSSITRIELWKNDCVTFYLDMLKENYWQTFSLNSLAIWLSYNPADVGKLLIESSKLPKLIDFFRLASLNTIQSLHKPLYDMMLKSKELSRALACSTLFVAALVKRLNSTSEAIILRSLLKMLQLMHQYHPCPRNLVLDNELYGLVKEFAQSEGQVLVCQIANRLLRDFQLSTLS